MHVNGIIGIISFIFFQIHYSKTESCQNLTDYFDKVKENVIENINKRLSYLLSKVESIANEALEPLQQCEDVINQSLAAAARIMQDGTNILYMSQI